MTACFFTTHFGAYGPCQGRLDRHHVIRKNRLKQQFPHGARYTAGGWRPAERWAEYPDGHWLTVGDILADPRNLITLCRKHHDLVEGKRIYIPRSAMQSVEEFARDYGLEGWLDRYTKEAA